jgi:hypothetical protein
VSKLTIANNIDRYLQTGEHDPLFVGFPGSDHFDRIGRGYRVLADALVAEVHSRAPGEAAEVPAPFPTDVSAFAQQRIEPMVQGLFRRTDRVAVTKLLADSVVFITPGTVDSLIEREDPHSAWLIANIFLRSIGLDAISDQAPPIVGFSVSTTCYVSLEYFHKKSASAYSDYVVHEAAHIFHNARRRDAGLLGKKEDDWLLPIEFSMRETFAYACEAYSRICALGLQARRESLEKLRRLPPPADERVNTDEYFAILTSALDRRNGWKSILEGCSEQRSQ